MEYHEDPNDPHRSPGSLRIKWHTSSDTLKAR